MPIIGIDEEVLTKYAYQLSNDFEAINSKYLQMMGKHIKDIGELSATDIHRLEQMTRLGQNTAKINKALVQASGKTMDELNSLLINKAYFEYPFSAQGVVNATHFNDNKVHRTRQLQMATQSILNMTGKSMMNLSKTTAISQTYRNLVDTAIKTVTSGVGDFQKAMRSHLKKAGTGARVTYASGRTRRLDSAVRMNILEGVSQYNEQVRSIVGEQFGADGVEVTTHMLCATDHLDIQGQQYALTPEGMLKGYELFEEVNWNLDRQIGTLNCRHSTFPIILGISTPEHTQEELNYFKSESTKLIDVGGVSRTKYEWSQVCRSLETEMRYAKDTHIIAEAAGDDVLKRQSSQRLTKLRRKYNNICEKTNLPKSYYRTYVPGYSKAQTVPKPVITTPEQFVAHYGQGKYTSFGNWYQSLDDETKKIYQKLKKQSGLTNNKFYAEHIQSDKAKEKAIKLKEKKEAKKLAQSSTAPKVEGGFAGKSKDEIIQQINDMFSKQDFYELEKYSEHVINSIPKIQRSALTTYTGSAYTPMNTYLRELARLKSKQLARQSSRIGETLLKKVETCIKALDKNRLGKTLMLRRGSSFGDLAGFIPGDYNDNKRLIRQLLDSGNIEQLQNMFNGGVFEFASFTSTAALQDAGFGGELEFILFAPDTSKAMDIISISQFTNEAEVLLSPGTKIRIIEIEKASTSNHLLHTRGCYSAELRVYAEIIPM